jgi:hypothetical protein
MPGPGPSLGHTAAVDGLLVVLLLMAIWAVPLLVVVLPPVALVDAPRRSPAAGGLWLFAVALVAGWVRALLVGMDRADATGAQGPWLDGGGWLVAAAAAATASVLVARRQGAAASGTLTR